PPDRLAGAVMLVLGGPNETIVRNTKFIEQLAKIAGHFIRKLAGSDAKIPRLLGHLQPMLVGSCLKAHVAAAQALETREDVRGDRLVGVADVRATVRIMNRGGEVIGLSHAPGH